MQAGAGAHDFQVNHVVVEQQRPIAAANQYRDAERALDRPDEPRQEALVKQQRVFGACHVLEQQVGRQHHHHHQREVERDTDDSAVASLLGANLRAEPLLGAIELVARDPADALEQRLRGGRRAGVAERQPAGARCASE